MMERPCLQHLTQNTHSDARMQAETSVQVMAFAEVDANLTKNTKITI